jgi:transcriptional regulator GlxA family with amidase domain
MPGMKTEILIFDGFDDLDGFGPFEVLNGAALEARFVTVEPCEYVTSSHGARVVPHGVLGDPDLVLVPGGGWDDKSGPGVHREARKGLITAALQRRHAAGGRIGSVCTGAMMLAEAGLLTGRRAITHHGSIEDLRGFGAIVQEDARFVDDGDILTAAGVTAGIDMALHLVANERGEDVAAARAEDIEWTQSSRASSSGRSIGTNEYESAISTN